VDIVLDPTGRITIKSSIYETKRIKHEKEWKLLFRESGVSSNTEIVVLSGVPSSQRQAKKLRK